MLRHLLGWLQGVKASSREYYLETKYISKMLVEFAAKNHDE